MKFLLWLAVLVVAFFILARYVERHNIYFPMKEIDATPELLGLPYEEVYLETRDNKRLHAWFIPNDEARLTVLFCHGNAGNIGHRLEKLIAFYNMGLNIFIFDYRGYGKSEGSPSEDGLYKDASSAYNYLVKERGIPKDNIVVYGESLGGAVAIHLAGEERVGGVITEEAFTSVRDMARIVYPFIPPFIISNKFDSASLIKDVASPKLIIHSVNDEIVPFYLGERLFNTASEPKKLLKIRGSHNTAFFDSRGELIEGIESFLNEIK